MRYLMLLLFAPGLTWGTLMEWTGTGSQTYYWEDQAHPTASISILADESRIHEISVTNTKTTFSFLDPVVDFYWSASLSSWSGGLTVRGFAPEQYPGDPNTLLNTIISWDIPAPSRNTNPLTMLGNVWYVGVGTDQFREFNFEPDIWTQQCVADCNNGDPAGVPEPASVLLLAFGLLGIFWRRRIA